MVIFTDTGEVGTTIIGVDMVGIAITVAIDGSIMVDQDLTVIVITLVGGITLGRIEGLDLAKFMDPDLDLTLGLGLDLAKFMDPDLDLTLGLGLDLAKFIVLGRVEGLIKVVRICVEINDKL